MNIRSDDIRKAVGTDMTSDPGDPHGWMFNCEVLNPAHIHHQVIKAWWTCRRCGTTIRVMDGVRREPNSGNEAYDEMAALSRMYVMANVERERVHPRCSEVRAVKEVMRS